MTGSGDSGSEGVLKRIFDKYLSVSERDSQIAAAAKHGVLFRFRPPYKRTCKHDARGDGVNLVIQNMIERGVPLWAAHYVSRRFVDECADQYFLNQVPFDESTYESINAAEWCRDVTACFETFAQKYAHGEYELPKKPSEWDQYPYSLYSYKNRKPKMEDRHVVLPSLTVIESSEDKAEKVKNDALFAVFDGHNGTDCAAYAATHIADCLLEILAKNEDKKSILNDVFNLLDRRLTLRCIKEHLKSGTTACCAYLFDSTAYLAWCGDSSIGVLRNNEVVTLSKRHSPSLPEEAQRIEAAGGMVLNIQGEARLNGVLNVSRSLGDIDGRPMVSQEPDHLAYPIDNNTDYIMYFSSDGIWDTLDESQILKSTQDFIAAHPSSDYDKLADYLGSVALDEGASDNLTMIVVYLDIPENVWTKVRSSLATALSTV